MNIEGLTHNALNTPRAAQAGLRGAVQFLQPHRFAIALGFVALMVGAATNLFLPELLRRFINLIGAGEEAIHSGIGGLLLITLLVFAIQGIAFFLRTRQFGAVSHRVAGALRSALYVGVLNREVEFFDRHRSGDLASRLSAEVQLIQDVLGVRAIVLLRYGIQVAVGVVLMGLVSTKLTVALVSALVVLVAVGFLFARALRRASKRLNAEIGALTGLFTEALSGVRFLQAHSSVGWMVGKLDQLNQVAIERGRDRVGVSSAFQSFVSFLLNSALVILGVYGILLVSRGELAAGDFGAFVSYAAIVAVSFSFLVASISEVSQAMGAWERLSEVIGVSGLNGGIPRDANGRHAEGRSAETPPTIEFDNVSFSYAAVSSGDRSEKARPALEGVSVTISPGERIALVGRSGAGKSTALALLLGAYRPDSGRIRVSWISGDNNPQGGSAEFDSLKGLVVYVPQDPQLFGLSVRDNLLIAAPQASDATLMQALERARLGDLFVGGEARLTLDAVIGERGLSLSAGQRQRLALARAFLSDAKVVLLDEPTSNLDGENEHAIQEVLSELFAGRTTITVAHRFSTIMSSDRVLVLDNGRLIEQGSPKELIERRGAFHHLAALQG
jgi:ATP-binding cassette subfamily B protein